MHELLDIQQWAGTEASLAAYMRVIDNLFKDAKVMEMVMAPPKKEAFVATAEQPVELPRLLSINEGVATIAIRGSLVNSASWINQYLGLTG